MSNISKRRREGSRTKIKSVGDHKEFLKRITKTLYYGQLPSLPSLSLPVTEVSCEVWSAWQRGRSVRRLHADAAAGIARSACVSPCALVLALLYLERLNACNPRYLTRAAPQDLFLVSLMVGNKFLQDDGEDEEVICSEWAASGGIDLERMKKLEIEFLNAIEWNVFVSDKSFEAGLSWLERRVAWRQARARGFFTYTELAACGRGDAGDAARAVLAVAAGYLGGLLALAASALLLTHACTSALQLRDSALTTLAPLPPLIPPSPSQRLPPGNATVELGGELVAGEARAAARARCCECWMQLRKRTAPAPRRGSYEAVLEYAWPEPWWASTSLLNWLYQSSLVTPLQRWLQTVDVTRTELPGGAAPAPCGSRRWLPAGAGAPELGAFLVTVSDR